MKVVAVIQARLGSTRLPRKILLPLAGKSMLQNVVERVSRAKLIDEVVVACPFSPAEDYETIADICAPKQNGERVAKLCCLFAPRVDENDLIGRLLKVAVLTEADAIVRICADNPCVEAGEIDNLIKFVGPRPPREWLYTNAEDFTNNHDGFGGEFYTIDMLEMMDSFANSKIVREHPHKFWVPHAWQYIGKSYLPGFRLDVDTQADYDKLRTIFDHFGHNQFSVKEAMDFLGSQDLEKRYLP